MNRKLAIENERYKRTKENGSVFFTTISANSNKFAGCTRHCYIQCDMFTPALRSIARLSATPKGLLTLIILAIIVPLALYSSVAPFGVQSSLFVSGMVFSPLVTRSMIHLYIFLLKTPYSITHHKWKAFEISK